MRYLVRAKLKPGKRNDLLQAIDREQLGQGSVAEGEYLYDMARARRLADNTLCWVETCFCPTPLEEERSYWEEYFKLLQIKNAHNRKRCRDLYGTQAWACCDCTKRLEAEMENWGRRFISELRAASNREEGR